MPYTRAEIDAAIQAAAEAMGEPLSKEAYRQFRAEQGGREARIPVTATIARTEDGYDTWTAACEANDVEPYTPGPEPSVSIADRVRALRAAASELGEPLGRTEYREWRHQRDAPTIGAHPHTAPEGIRGWSDWCLLAGVEPHAKHNWTPAECQYALRLAAHECEGVLSPQAYERWRTDAAGHHPSRTVFRSYWPSFTAARTIALGDPEDVPSEAWEE